MTDLDFWSHFGLEESLIFTKNRVPDKQAREVFADNIQFYSIRNGVDIEIILTTTHTLSLS